LNFSGFMVPRYAKEAGFANNGFEYPYDPLECGRCYWEDPYYEDVLGRTPGTLITIFIT
jgi:hypothetical protein